MHFMTAVSTGYAQDPNFRHKKTTRRWFHDTAYCFDYSAFFPWYPERDLNSYSLWPRDFKSLVSTDSTIRAREESGGAFRSRTGLDGFAIRYITALLTRLKSFVFRLTPAIAGAFKFGAGNETRTRDPDLGKVVLYQLSYSRITKSLC